MHSPAGSLFWPFWKAAFNQVRRTAYVAFPNKKSNLLSWLWVFYLSLITAHATLSQPDLPFKHLTILNGLSNNKVSSITQDAEGFIWIGTDNGLNRYDGYEAVSFSQQENDSTSLHNGHVTCLFADTAGLWIGTTRGLSWYSKSQRSFTRLGSNRRLPEDKVKAIAQDHQGRLWIGYKNDGLYRYDPRRQEVVCVANAQDKIHVLSMFRDQRDRLWVGHRRGVLMWEANSTPSLTRATSYLSGTHVNNVRVLDNGQLWVATKGQGYGVRDSVSEQWHFSTGPDERYQHARVLASVGNHELWVGSDQGIVQVHYRGDSLMGIPVGEESLSDPSITSLYQDRAGHVWIGTYHGGVNFLGKNQRMFQHYSYAENATRVNNNAVSALAAGLDSTLWVGMPRGGLQRFDLRRKKFTSITDALPKAQGRTIQHVKALLPGDGEKVWVGTHNNGLFAYDALQRTLTKLTLPPETDHPERQYSVRTLARDYEGNLFISLNPGGVGWYHEPTGRIHWLGKELDYQVCEAILRDDRGQLWIGTIGGVILIHDIHHPDRQTTFRHQAEDARSLSHNHVQTLIQDRQGQVWVGTEDGLNRFCPEDSSFKVYRTTEGLPDNSIKSITEDKGGTLWLGTANGLSRFDPKGEGQNFYQEDGLQSNQFLTNSALRIDRTVYVGGVNGFNVFQPAALSSSKEPASVVLTNLRVNGQPTTEARRESMLSRTIKTNDQIVLTHHQPTFTVEYKTIDFTASSDREYQYLLEGYDHHWYQAGSEQAATYSNVPPGRYVFRVKNCRRDGTGASAEARLRIRILPPWWETWWAQTIIALLLVTAVYLIMRLHWKWQYEKKQKEKLFQLDMMKVHFFTNVSHEIKTPLTLIKTPLDKMVRTGNANPEGLQIMQKNTNHLCRLIDQLLDFREVEAGLLQPEVSYGNVITFTQDVVDSFRTLAQERTIQFELDSELSQQFVWFDENIVEKVLYNLLSNAFKYTEAGGSIRVSVDDSEGLSPLNAVAGEGEESTHSAGLRFCVRDSGVGIPPQKLPFVFNRFYRGLTDKQRYEGTGIGLAHTRELVALHQGTIDIESQEGHGTAVFVYLPTRREAYHPGSIKSVEAVVHSTQASYADTPPLAEEPRRSVLIVEDNPDISRIIATEFDQNYTVMFASDGESGWAEARKHLPDLVISDVVMPRQSGIEMCQQLKANPATSHIPVILLTALGDVHHQWEGLQSGADDYLSKPFNVDVLRMKINNMLLTRQRLIAKYRSVEDLPIEALAVSANDKEFLTKAEQFVRQTIDNADLRLEDLVEALHVSRPVIFRKFKALLNETPKEFIKSMRLRRAAELLRHRPGSLRDVAYEVGFNDPKYFSKCFKQFHGLTPAQFVR